MGMAARKSAGNVRMQDATSELAFVCMDAVIGKKHTFHQFVKRVSFVESLLISGHVGSLF